MSAALLDAGIAFGRVAFVMMFVLNLAGLLGWVERKQSAIMQDRIGANRASIFGFRALGLFHPLADALKMLTKEDFRPARADRFLFELAPFVSVFFALVAFASIPFGDTLRIGDRVVPLQAVTLNVGVLYVFAMLSLGVYGVMMAGWSSANNYALLGGQRAAALMISAEIAIGASIMGVVMVYGSLNLQDIVRGQGTLLLGWLPAWGIITQPLAFVLFLTAGIAATKRDPVRHAGGRVRDHRLLRRVQRHEVRHVPDDRLRGDDGHRRPDCTSLFLGGWQVPYLLADGFHFPWGRRLGAAAPARGDAAPGRRRSSPRSRVMIFILMLIRWTLPRFRYDQAMRLGWLGLFPLSIAQHRADGRGAAAVGGAR